MTIQAQAEGDIPREVAMQLCEEVRRQIKAEGLPQKLMPKRALKRMWCWGCRTFSGANPDKMCFSSLPSNRGCGQVNALYAGRYEVWKPKGGPQG